MFVKKFIALSLLFFIIRLIHLNSIPILNDEGIYLHWGSQMFDQNATIRFNFTALDGKQIGVPILFGITQMLPLDPLVSSRSAIAIISYVTFLSIVLVHKKLYPKSSFLSMALLIIFCPYLVYYDRTALPDSIVVACFSLAFMITVYNTKHHSLKRDTAIGAAIATGWWFKSTILLVLPAIFILYFYELIKKIKPIRELIISLSLIIFSFFLFVSPLLLSNSYLHSPAKDFNRLINFANDLNTLLNTRWLNFLNIIQWFTGYTTPITVIALIFVLLYRPKNIIYPLICFCVPLVLVIFLLRDLFAPRWIVFLVPVYLILVHEGISSLPKYKNIFFGLIIGIMAVLSITQIFFPLSYYRFLSFVPKAQGDLDLAGWTSGYGVKDAADYIKSLPQQKKIIVFISIDHSGNPEDGIYIYLRKVPNVIVIGDINYQYLIRFKNHFKDVIESADFYYISRGNQLSYFEKVLIPVSKFKKPLDEEFVGVYKIRIE